MSVELLVQLYPYIAAASVATSAIATSVRFKLKMVAMLFGENLMDMCHIMFVVTIWLTTCPAPNSVCFQLLKVKCPAVYDCMHNPVYVQYVYRATNVITTVSLCLAELPRLPRFYRCGHYFI